MRTFVPLLKAVGTGITGLRVEPEPLPVLRSLYTQTLRVLDKMPEHAVYRVATEALVNERLAAVEAGKTREELEQQFQSGLVEEIIMQARDELRLSKQMLQHRVWEDLEDAPPPGQWEQLERK